MDVHVLVQICNAAAFQGAEIQWKQLRSLNLVCRATHQHLQGLKRFYQALTFNYDLDWARNYSQRLSINFKSIPRRPSRDRDCYLTAKQSLHNEYYLMYEYLALQDRIDSFSLFDSAVDKHSTCRQKLDLSVPWIQ